MKRVIGRTDMEDALKKLDELTQEEARMAIAENLRATHAVDQSVARVDDRVGGVSDQVAGVDDRVASVDDRVAIVNDNVASVGDRVATVDDTLKVVDDKVDEVIQGAQIIVSQSPKS